MPSKKGKGINMDYEDIILEQDDGIITMSLNRPEKLNALGAKLLEEIADVVEHFEGNDDAKVLVITGKGRGFCSGADLKSPVSGADTTVPGMPRGVKLEPFARFGRVFSLLYQTRKPTIAAVNGIASGAGLSLASICDIRIASETATFSAIFVRRGLVSDCGATFLLPRIIGTSKALEMMWTGDFIDADEALRFGLVSRIVPPDELMHTASSLADRIAKGPSLAIESMKRNVYRGMENDDFDAQMALEAFSQNICRVSEDCQEGISSFIEKREPQFKGR
jgi:2-(1,2-epoxy-1,2-dihydrophenyl)acetyl-CoA isomerase